MVDISRLPAHVQEAIKKMDLGANAHVRVINGVKWLELEAPEDWRLQMISIHDGKVASQVRTCRNDENVLALAFRRVEKYKGADGRVVWANVRDVLGTMDYRALREYAQARGFMEKEHRVDNTIISSDIDAEFLDHAWAHQLSNLEWHAQPVMAYPKVA